MSELLSGGSGRLHRRQPRPSQGSSRRQCAQRPMPGCPGLRHSLHCAGKRQDASNIRRRRSVAIQWRNFMKFSHPWVMLLPDASIRGDYLACILAAIGATTSGKFLVRAAVLLCVNSKSRRNKVSNRFPQACRQIMRVYYCCGAGCHLPGGEIRLLSCFHGLW